MNAMNLSQSKYRAATSKIVQPSNKISWITVASSCEIADKDMHQSVPNLHTKNIKQSTAVIKIAPFLLSLKKN